jgi:hypothetical protein
MCLSFGVELIWTKIKALPISFAAVKFASSSPMTGAPTGGTNMTIEGRGFLNLQQPPTVWIGAKSALQVKIVSNTEVTCSVLAGHGRNLQVRVTPSAKLYPGKPILLRPAALENDFQDTPSDCLVIAGKSTTLRTGFSYDGNEIHQKLCKVCC